MPYVYDPVNPLQSFAQGFQAVTGIRQQRAAEQQAMMEQQAKQQRQIALQQAVQNLRVNPSPQAIADFGLQFPEMAKPMQEYFSTLSEASKKTELDAMQDALIAEKTDGDIAGVYDRYAEAAANSRDEALAKKFRDAAEFARQNPEGAAQVTKLRLAFADGDTYKRVYDSDVQLDTTQIKNLIGEGLKPGTPQFQAALREERRKVSFFHPDYGFVSGSPEFVQQVFGGAMPTDTEKLPRVTTQQGYDALAPGQKYIGPDGMPYTKKGGAASNGGGNFQSGR